MLHSFLLGLIPPISLPFTTTIIIIISRSFMFSFDSIIKMLSAHEFYFFLILVPIPLQGNG